MQNKPFKQTIKNVQGSTALVESKKGNIYPVIISDYARIHKAKYLKVGSIALVRRINGKYYLIDAEFKEEDYHLSNIDLKDLGYDYE